MEDDACEVEGLDGEENSGEEKQANKNTLDMTKLDDKSFKILTLLMMKITEQDVTVQDFFIEDCFLQQVANKGKKFTMTLIKAEDFFRVIKDKGVRSNYLAHDNLQQFLQLSAKFPNLLKIKTSCKYSSSWESRNTLSITFCLSYL